MKLAFITKGSQNPRGKSKIYFCGHPADYGAPFRQIAEDILETPSRKPTGTKNNISADYPKCSYSSYRLPLLS